MRSALNGHEDRLGGDLGPCGVVHLVLNIIRTGGAARHHHERVREVGRVTGGQTFHRWR